MKKYWYLPLLLIVGCVEPSKKPEEGSKPSVYHCPFKKIVSTNDQVSMQEGVVHHINLMLGLGLPVKLGNVKLDAGDSIVISNQLKSTSYAKSFYSEATMDEYNKLITTVCSQLEAIETSNVYDSLEKKNKIKEVLEGTGEYLQKLLNNSISSPSLKKIEEKVVTERKIADRQEETKDTISTTPQKKIKAGSYQVETITSETKVRDLGEVKIEFTLPERHEKSAQSWGPHRLSVDPPYIIESPRLECDNRGDHRCAFMENVVINTINERTIEVSGTHRSRSTIGTLYAMKKERYIDQQSKISNSKDFYYNKEFLIKAPLKSKIVIKGKADWGEFYLDPEITKDNSHFSAEKAETMNELVYTIRVKPKS